MASEDSQVIIPAVDPDFEQRVQNMRRAVLALYVDDPSPATAHLLVMMEQTIVQARKERSISLAESAASAPDAG